MRTTLRIDERLLRELKELARSQKISLNSLINQLLERGLTAPAPHTVKRTFRQQTFAMGAPRVDITKGLLLAGALEDEAILEKLSLRK